MREESGRGRAKGARLDKTLVDRGLVVSRERAQAMILAGRVLVEEQKVDKPGTGVSAEAQIRLLGEDLRYVSRGGLKLQGAIERWGIELGGRMCVDIGVSTGGFTDCMLQHGAAFVLGADTGYGQMAERLRQDGRMRLLERTNARLLVAGQLRSEAAMLSGGEPAPSFFAMDVSFISATLVLPGVVGALAPEGVAWVGEAVVLVKPQFEAGREHVGKGGIVRDEGARQGAVERVRAKVEELGGTGVEVIPSPLLGAEGNQEFLLHAWFGRERGAEQG